MRGPRELAPGVYGLGSDIVNWYLVDDGGRLTAVDAGHPGFAGTLEEDLGAIGRSVADVEAVVLTHSDGDHTGVAARLREAGARVLIHAADVGSLANPGPKGGDASIRHVLPNLWRPLVRTVLADAIRNGGAHPARVSDASAFADGDVLDVPGRPRVVATPGHTPGHCAILLEDRGVLFAGDALITHELVTRGQGPRLMPRYVNVDNEACLASLDRIAEVEADTILCGHGDPWRGSPASAARQARDARLGRR